MKPMITQHDILNARILIVDDNESNLMLLERTLSNANYTSIVSVTDSRKVIELYHGYKPDIILLDINMPHLDGFEIIKQLKETGGDHYLPILVLTAQQDIETRLRALESGAMDFLTKPFNTTETVTRIKNMLMVRLLHNQVLNQNILLEQKVRERTTELNETRLEIIRRLGLAAEFKDNETGFHIIRMSQMCQAIGKAAKMDDHEVELLLNSSPMHDIGKIGIPDSILLKPGALSEEEWETMKTHTLVGARMLGGHGSELLKMATTIALTHHEKWDGSGYPNGLSGEEIPLSGRIAAIADVFDALTSVRPYKKAWSVEDSIAEIKRTSGSHFDPSLVDIFFSIINKIILIKDAHEEPV